MKILIAGLAVMAFVWAVQAQAAEVTRQDNNFPERRITV
jgi:hypothetical protein